MESRLLTTEEEVEIIRLAAEGWKVGIIARRVKHSRASVRGVMNRGKVRTDEERRTCAGLRISDAEIEKRKCQARIQHGFCEKIGYVSLESVVLIQPRKEVVLI